MGPTGSHRIVLYAGALILLAGLLPTGYGLVSRIFLSWEEGFIRWEKFVAPVSLLVGWGLLMLAICPDLHRGVRVNASVLPRCGLAFVFIAILAVGF